MLVGFVILCFRLMSRSEVYQV